MTSNNNAIIDLTQDVVPIDSTTEPPLKKVKYTRKRGRPCNQTPALHVPVQAPVQPVIDIMTEDAAKPDKLNNKEFWLDASYREAIEYDFAHLTADEAMEHRAVGVLDSNELCQKIQNFQTNVNCQEHIPKQYDACITDSIELTVTEDTNIFELVQIALACNEQIAICCKTLKHSRFYWNGWVLNLRSNEEYYQCPEKTDEESDEAKGVETDEKNDEAKEVEKDTKRAHKPRWSCKWTCKRGKDNRFWYRKDAKHKHLQKTLHRGQNRMSAAKFALVNDLILAEIELACARQTSNIDDKLHSLYNRIVSRYRQRIPLVDMTHFCGYNELKQRMSRWNPIHSVYVATDIQSFIEHELSPTISKCYKSPSKAKQCKENLRYSCDTNGNFIISNIDLLKILYYAHTVSADGTFAIRPVFIAKKNNSGRKGKRRVVLHDQVFKLFAVYTYDVQGHPGVTQEKAYLIAIGLLHGKSTAAYTWFLQQLQTFIQQAKENENWTESQERKSVWDNFICDYEKALRNAVTQIQETQRRILGDTFHFAYNILKKLRRIGLSKWYSRKKNNVCYDSTFRALIEAIYALQYVHPHKIPEFGKTICQLLLKHCHHVYDRNEDHTTMNQVGAFVWYFMHIYLQYDKRRFFAEIIQNYPCIQSHLATKKTSPNRYKITEWCVFGQDVTSNNSAEANNRWDVAKLGIRPVICKLIQWFIEKIEETMQMYLSVESRHKIPVSSMHAQSLKKKLLLHKYAQMNETMDWSTFVTFSHKLAIIRCDHKGESPLNVMTETTQNPEQDTIDMHDLLEVPDLENENSITEVEVAPMNIPKMLNTLYINHMKDAPKMPMIRKERTRQYITTLEESGLKVPSLDVRYSTRISKPPTHKGNRFT